MRLIVLLSILVNSGCIFSSSSEGTLEVRWRIGAGVQTCEEAGLDSVEVTLEEDGGDVLGPYSTSCESGRSDVFVLDGIDEGDYTIIVDAFAGDELVYTGQSRDTVFVEANSTVTSGTVVLSPIPASLQVLWRFEDGRQCGFHDVDEMLVEAFLNNAVAEEVVVPCADGEAIIEDVLPGTYDVQVTALDVVEQLPVFRFTEPNIAVEAGSQIEVDGILLPCEDIEDNCL
jgi:hypothetical protein